MEIINLGTIIPFALGILFGTITTTYLEHTSKLKPKFKVGQCVIFEQNSKKQSGVIVEVRYGKREKYIYQYGLSFRPETQVDKCDYIAYKVDVNHAKLDYEIHIRDAAFPSVTRTSKACYIWVEESAVATAYVEE